MDYTNGKIYKIVNDVNDEIYVGSTCQRLSKRMVDHRAKAKQKIILCGLYNMMNTIGVEHFKIVLIENYSCNGKEELHAREEHFRNELRATLNNRRCYITEQQRKDRDRKSEKLYIDRNINVIREKRRRYYEANKEKIQEKKKAHYMKNREKIIAIHMKYYWEKKLNDITTNTTKHEEN
jgi:hypothetical protein